MNSTGFELKVVLVLALMLFSLRCLSQQFSFSTGTFHPLYAGNIKWSDLDNDKDLDLIYFGFEEGANDFYTKVYENQNGNFVERTTTLPQLRNGAIELGDFDNDGDADILMSGLSISGNISELHENLGGFNFARKYAFPGLINTSIAIFDIDNDDDLDFVLNGFNDAPVDENTTQQSEVYVYKNNLNEFIPVLTTNIRPCAACVMAPGDSNGDGWVDLAVSGFEDDGLLYTYLYVNKRDLTFQQDTSEKFKELFSGDLTWVDYDNDGDLDLFLSGGSADTMLANSIIYENTESGWIEHADFFEFPLFENARDGLQWADFNNDGYLDLVITGRGDPINLDLKFIIYINNSGNSFSLIEDTSFTGTADASIDIGDYDNDGDLDIAFTGLLNGYPSTAIYINNSLTSTFQFNGKPIAPNLISFKEENFYRKSFQLKWDRGSDDKTSANALMYNFYIRNSSKKIVVPSVNYSNGYVRSGIVPNGGMGVAKVDDLPEGNLYWAVQSIDGGRLGSNFSNEKNFYYLYGPESKRTEIITPQSVKLTWLDNSSVETSYKVERSTELNTNFSVLATLSENSSEYVDNFSFIPDTYYYYRVYAVNNSAQSGYDTLRVLIPKAPIDLNSVSINASRIDLSWSDQSLYEKAYVVERRKFGDVAFEPIDTLDSNSQAFVDNGLEEGTQYEYRVRATNYYGSSAYSNIKLEKTNFRPSASNFSMSTNEDVVLNLSSDDFIEVFTDIDETDQLVYIKMNSLPSKGLLSFNGELLAIGQQLSTVDLADVSYVPATNINGSDSFTFSVSDGKDYSTSIYTLTIEVASVNDSPSFAILENLEANEDFIGTLKVNPVPSPVPSDEVQQKVTYSISPLVSEVVTVQLDENTGEIKFQSKLNQNGSQKFVLTANDGQSENNLFSKEISLLIKPINDAPTISKISDVELETNATFPPITFQVGDIDNNLSDLTIKGASSNTALVKNEKIQISGTGENRNLQIVPESNLSGETIISLDVSDGLLTTRTTFKITLFTVTSVKDKLPLQVAMYPNPSKGILHISFAEIDTQSMLLIVSDMTGRALIEQQLSDNTSEISLQHLTMGQYVVHIYHADKLIYRQRITKE